MEGKASVKHQVQRSENTKDAGLHFKSKITNTSLELENSKDLNTTTLGKHISTMGHDYTDSLVQLSHVDTRPCEYCKNGVFILHTF